MWIQLLLRRLMRPGRRENNAMNRKFCLMRSGQATLELSVALIVVMILLVAIVRTFVWFNEKIVKRQAGYESTRVAAGSTPHDIILLEDSSSGGVVRGLGEEGIQLVDSAHNPVEEVLVDDPDTENLSLVF